MNFSARTKGLVPSRSLFQWTVSNGAIESGQGTRSINVRVPPNENGGNVTATVTLTGLPNACLVTASEIAPIASIPPQDPVDIYGKISLFNEYARVQNGVAAAIANPTSLLVIIREAHSFGSFERTRINKIKDFIRTRLRFPTSHLRIITKIGPQIQNTIWLVPPGAKMPE